MMKLVSLFAAVLLASFSAMAQNGLNDDAESITGIYKVVHKGGEYQSCRDQRHGRNIHCTGHMGGEPS